MVSSCKYEFFQTFTDATLSDSLIFALRTIFLTTATNERLALILGDSQVWTELLKRKVRTRRRVGSHSAAYSTHTERTGFISRRLRRGRAAHNGLCPNACLPASSSLHTVTNQPACCLPASQLCYHDL